MLMTCGLKRKSVFPDPNHANCASRYFAISFASPNLAHCDGLRLMVGFLKFGFQFLIGLQLCILHVHVTKYAKMQKSL